MRGSTRSWVIVWTIGIGATLSAGCRSGATGPSVDARADDGARDTASAGMDGAVSDATGADALDEGARAEGGVDGVTPVDGAAHGGEDALGIDGPAGDAVDAPGSDSGGDRTTTSDGARDVVADVASDAQVDVGGSDAGHDGGASDGGSDAVCVPSCSGKSCGGDGCGGGCGICPAMKHCTAAFVCVGDVVNSCGASGGLDPQAPWPTAGRCYSRRGATTTLSVQSPAVRWTYAASPQSNVAIARDGNIYFGARDVSGSSGRRLQAVKPDGTAAWSVAMGDTIDTPTIGADGNVHFIASQQLYTVGADGTVAAHVAVPAGATRVMVTADGTAYYADSSYTLTAVAPNGQVRFALAGAASPDMAAALGDDGALYVVGSAGVSAVLPDGRVRWQAPRADGEGGSAGVVVGPDGTVYVPFTTASAGGIHALDPATGATKWTAPVTDFAITLPAVAGDGTVYLPVWDELYAIAADGTLRWVFPVGDIIYDPPAVGGDGTIYFFSTDGNFYAINADGSVKWVMPLAGGGTPSIGADGTLYVRALGGITAIGCAGGACQACHPSCAGKACGPDGCGGSCGSCAAGQRCDLLARACQTAAEPAGAGACGDTRGLQAGAPWPEHRRCSTRVARTDAIGPRSGKVLWTYATGGAIASAPAIAADGTIYVGSADKQLHAVAPNGTARWKFSAANAIYATPAIAADGTIYFPSGGAAVSKGHVYAVRPDGTQRWTLSFPFGDASSAAVAGDGTVYFEVSAYVYTSRVVAFDPLTGTLLWNYMTPDILQASPAIGHDGTVYANSSVIYALRPTGAIRWRTAALMNLPASVPLVDSDGNIYAGWDGGVVSLRPDGVVRWNYSPGGSRPSAQGAPALLADGSILVPFTGDSPLSLVALKPADGTVRWSSRVGNAVSSSPIVDGAGWIFVAAADNTFYALDGSGQTQWSLPLGATASGSPALGANGVIYQPTSDGKLLAIGAAQ